MSYKVNNLESMRERIILDSGVICYLDSTLKSMSFIPNKAKYTFWMKQIGDHYEYIATFIGDLLVFGKKPMKSIESIRE